MPLKECEYSDFVGSEYEVRDAQDEDKYYDPSGMLEIETELNFEDDY